MTTLLATIFSLAASAPTWTSQTNAPLDPPKALLVECADLHARLGDPNLRILDARSRADYDKGHIPGAVWVDEPAAQKIAGRPGGLNDIEAWQAWIKPLGIGPETEVIVVDGARQLSAARIWWLLGYLGAPRVGLLNGNVAYWQSQGLPLTAGAPKVEPSTLTVVIDSERHATRDDVLKSLADARTQIVDARSRDEYTGADAKSKRSGHIPEACHLEWTNVVDQNGRFLPAEELRARFASAGLKPGTVAISHCQGGGRASVNAFVLERLGHKTRNYYLGWSDWGNVDDTPVDK